MNRREFLNVAPIAIVPLVLNKKQPVEELWFHHPIYQSQPWGTWLQTWGTMKYQETHTFGKLVDARVGIANIIPPCRIVINNLPFLQGEVVAITYKHQDTHCDYLSCPCHTSPSSDIIIAIGKTDRTIICSDGSRHWLRKPCDFCSGPADCFSHASADYPAFTYCWACGKKGKRLLELN
jgi:hypothetical protein